jgi:hypothetical protein
MDLMVLNQDFEKIYIFDAYESLLWVDKYSEPGTFEISTPVTQEILDYVKPNYYLVNEASEHTMIVEDISIESDIENGNKIKIVGRSLESILDRRIVWKQTNIDGNLQQGILKILNQNIIFPESMYPNPSEEQQRRKIANFIFKETNDPNIVELTMDHQYTGDNILDVVKNLCDENKIGFKVILNDNYQFVFSLYTGVDRSYNQDLVPYVVFSPSFDNILSSNYVDKNSIVKNVALVAGEGEGSERKTIVVGSESGLSRREAYVQASGLNSEELTPAQYNAKLTSKGVDELLEINKDKESFDGKCETTQLYSYGKDFYIGDVVQMFNEYGMETSSRITEFTWSCSTSELETYPTFVSIENEGGTS